MLVENASASVKMAVASALHYRTGNMGRIEGDLFDAGIAAIIQFTERVDLYGNTMLGDGNVEYVAWFYHPKRMWMKLCEGLVIADSEDATAQNMPLPVHTLLVVVEDVQRIFNKERVACRL